MHIARLPLAAVAVGALLLTGCQTTDMQMGSQSAKTVATGSAAGSAIGQHQQRARALRVAAGHRVADREPVGRLVHHPAQRIQAAADGQPAAPAGPAVQLLRRGRARRGRHERHVARARPHAASGEMRQGSNFGRGQMVASDYGMSPEIVFSNSNAGGAGGSLGGLVGGRYSGVLAAVGGNLQTKEASALLTLIDNRSGVQVAASEGSASKTDFGAFGSVFGGSGAGGARRLHQHRAGQGDQRRLHGRLQPDGRFAAQLQGADGARPGPGRRRSPGRRRRRRAVADLGARRTRAGTPQQHQEIRRSAQGAESPAALSSRRAFLRLGFRD